MRPAVLLALLLSVAAACDGAATDDHHAEHQDEHDHPAEDADHEPSGDAKVREVRISVEAQRHSGVTVGTVDRRAMWGGVAIPAEVQFDPRSTAHVGPLVSGRVTELRVALGDRVKQGQLLARIASSDAAATRARLGQAHAQLAAARSTVKRQRQLASEGIGARRALVDAEARLAELRAEVGGLRRQLQVLGSGKGGELALTAPIDGVVVSLHATLGETATPSQPLVIITDASKVWVRGNVPELQIAQVAQGAGALVRLHAFPELTLEGTVAYVSPALDEQSRSLPIVVTLKSRDQRVRGGLFGSIELVGDNDNRALAVPVDAVARVDGASVVFVASDAADTFRVQSVTLGRRGGGFVEVRAGLLEGTVLAISGAFTLKSVLERDALAEGHAH